MVDFDTGLLKRLYTPSSSSHKGENGKLLIIGGSHLFHSASLWSLQIASRIVDMVFYSSVPENNEIVQKAKEEFRNGIVVKREEVEHYINEADCVLIGPGMMRSSKFKVQSSPKQSKLATGQATLQFQIQNLDEINNLKDEGEQTYYLTKYILEKFPDKKYVIDAGALQMIEPEWLLGLKQTPILTPHKKEFSTLFELKSQNSNLKTIPTNSIRLESRMKTIIGTTQNLKLENENVFEMAEKYNCVILLKGEEDVVCEPGKCIKIAGGNAGMTKGGTGDVLAGLVSALYCKNEAFLSAACASYINKKAGEELFKRYGIYFNATDLANEIPKTMKDLILK